MGFVHSMYGGTVILERGVTIELVRSDAKEVEDVVPFKGITDLEEVIDGLPRYPGLNIVKTDTTVQIIVTGTTTLVGNDHGNN